MNTEVDEWSMHDTRTTPCRIIPAARIRDAAVRGVGLTQACMGMAAHVDSPAPDSGLTPVGETRIVPDLATLRQVPWKESHYMAQVDMCTFAGSLSHPI